jgi:hypothetical protein
MVCTFCLLEVEDAELEGLVVFHVLPRDRLSQKVFC